MSADRLARLLAIYAEIEEVAGQADPDLARAAALAGEADGHLAGLGAIDAALHGLLADVEASRAAAVAALSAARDRLMRQAASEQAHGGAARAYAQPGQADARFVDRRS